MNSRCASASTTRAAESNRHSQCRQASRLNVGLARFLRLLALSPDCTSLYSAAGFGISLAFLLLAVLPGRNMYAQDAKTDDQKIDKAFYSEKDRLAAMHAASLVVPTLAAGGDVMAGPPQDKKQFQLHFNDKVTCDFTTPGSKMGGKTPKFACQITGVESTDGQIQTLTPEMKEEPVKVKFGATDNEVYAEIVATRLMWVLGYYSDAWFPVRVECHNCPKNVITGSGPTATRTFAPANIVRKFSWHKMTEAGKDDEGWSWKELDTVNGRPTYERDGLKLLAAFMQHSDNKPPQQRLTCHKADVDNKTQPPTTTCDKSVMLVQDVGAPEVAVGQVVDPDQVLHRQRSIEAELVGHLGDVGWRREGARHGRDRHDEGHMPADPRRSRTRRARSNRRA